MDKLTMAHEMALKIAESGVSVDICAGLGWRYADAMQAEADKRKEKGLPEEIANARTFTHDSEGNCLHFHHEYGHKKCFDCGASLKEWQPDWSQAPDDQVSHWSKEKDGAATWWVGEPTLNIGAGTHHDNNDCSIYDDAPTFNYQGDWRNSLRKRPEVEAERNG